MAGKARAMAGKFPDCLYFVPNHGDSFRYVLHLPDCLYLCKSAGDGRKSTGETMLTPLDTSYTFLTVCTWFQTMSTPLEMSYTFLTVCAWFQTMSTPIEMSYTFLTVCT